MGMPPSTSGGLEDYTRDLTEMARAGQLEPVIGRDAEISRMIQILSRKTKNNPVLVGEAGVGKTALALGLAQRVASGNVPAEIAQMRVLELDLMNVVAGTRFRGDFEERMNNIIQDIEEDGHVILFIDELHTIMGSGSGIDSTLDAANILKPAWHGEPCVQLGPRLKMSTKSISKKMQPSLGVLRKSPLKSQVLQIASKFSKA